MVFFPGAIVCDSHLHDEIKLLCPKLDYKILDDAVFICICTFSIGALFTLAIGFVSPPIAVLDFSSFDIRVVPIDTHIRRLSARCGTNGIINFNENNNKTNL